MTDILKRYEEGERIFAGADLSSANLRCTNLSGADLRNANLYCTNLSRTDLSSANLRSANLRSANLRSANLSGANLSGADLRGANLRGANLSDANLSRTDLRGAVGIVSFGPVGVERRIGYAVAHDDGPRVQLGCFWGTLDEACEKIAKKYGEGSTYEALVRAACAVLNNSTEED